MYKRFSKEKLLEVAKYSPAICLNGARQLWKSTLVKYLSKFPYKTFDDLLAISELKKILGF